MLRLFVALDKEGIFTWLVLWAVITSSLWATGPSTLSLPTGFVVRIAVPSRHMKWLMALSFPKMPVISPSITIIYCNFKLLQLIE